MKALRVGAEAWGLRFAGLRDLGFDSEGSQRSAGSEETYEGHASGSAALHHLSASRKELVKAWSQGCGSRRPVNPKLRP